MRNRCPDPGSMTRELRRGEPRRDYNFVPSGRSSTTAPYEQRTLVTESFMHPASGRLVRLLVALFALVLFVPSAFAVTREARIQELLAVHDWKTTVALGNRYLKQQSLVATRSILSRIGRERNLGRDWKRGNASYDAAEAAIAASLIERVRTDWTSLAWMQSEWAGMADASFSAGELDTLVSHFQTDVGRKQAMIIDHTVQFHVAGALTMSGKLIDGFPGTEEEQKILTYVWEAEDREMRFSIQAVENVEGQRFALSPLGAKYQRTLIMKVSGMFGARMDRVAATLAEQARGLSASADPFVADFLAAGGR